MYTIRDSYSCPLQALFSLAGCCADAEALRSLSALWGLLVPRGEAPLRRCFRMHSGGLQGLLLSKFVKICKDLYRLVKGIFNSTSTCLSLVYKRIRAMAIQDANGMLRGKAGPLIYRKWRTLNLVQGLPRVNKKKRSASMKAAALEFGQASTVACSLRKSLSCLYGRGDEELSSRLVSRVFRSIQGSEGLERLHRNMHTADLSLLRGFEFNRHAEMREVFPVQPRLQRGADGLLQVHLPGFDLQRIKCPVRYGAYRLRLCLVAFDFREQYCEYLAWKDWELNARRMEALDWVPEVEIPKGTVVMLCMGLTVLKRYAGKHELSLNAPEWSPACIAEVWHEPAGAAPRRSAAEVKAEILKPGYRDGRFGILYLSDVLQRIEELAAQSKQDPKYEKSKPQEYGPPLMSLPEGKRSLKS